MHGYQVVAYTGNPRDEYGFSPALADSIVKSWAPTYDDAASAKIRMEREHGGEVRIE